MCCLLVDYIIPTIYLEGNIHYQNHSMKRWASFFQPSYGFQELCAYMDKLIQHYLGEATTTVWGWVLGNSQR